jgi:hypothetical protein
VYLLNFFFEVLFIQILQKENKTKPRPGNVKSDGVGWICV